MGSLTVEQRPCLRSAMIGGQWTVVRKCEAGLFLALDVSSVLGSGPWSTGTTSARSRGRTPHARWFRNPFGQAAAPAGAAPAREGAVASAPGPSQFPDSHL
eukprot:4454-Pyramimonas_sp.AAC.1